jgi:integrase/recombinase XerD
MLNAQRRHRPPCKRSEWDPGYIKCTCPIVIRGTIAGRHITVSTAKYLPPDRARDLQSARDLALLWEKVGAPIRPEEYAAPITIGELEAPLLPTVEMAVAAYMSDSRDRGNGEASLYKKATVFERTEIHNPRDRYGAKIQTDTTSLLWFCREKGIRFLSELTLATVREWRSSWKVNALTRYKRQKMVLGFFWFCERSGWYPRNYSSDLTKGLGKIEVRPTETGYFLPDEYNRLIDATYIYSDRPSVDRHIAPVLAIGGHRIRALAQLMRWTGLRIRDAATLERYRLSFDPGTDLWNVMVYQRKTGDPVYCPIPPHVAELLNTVPASQKGNSNERYFFWTGDGLAKTITSNWQRSFKKLFELAELKNADSTPKRCHPHMLRDTFAVEAILSDMPVQRVSEILGHKSIKTTEKHYLPWVRARQTSLNEAVKQSWIKQGVVKGPDDKRGPGRPRKAPVIDFPVAVGELG